MYKCERQISDGIISVILNKDHDNVVPTPASWLNDIEPHKLHSLFDHHYSQERKFLLESLILIIQHSTDKVSPANHSCSIMLDMAIKRYDCPPKPSEHIQRYLDFHSLSHFLL